MAAPRKAATSSPKPVDDDAPTMEIVTTTTPEKTVVTIDNASFAAVDPTDDLEFPTAVTRTRTRTANPFDELVANQKTRQDANPKAFTIADLSAMDESTEDGKKEVAGYASSLRNSAGRLGITVAFRSIPPAQRQAFANHAGLSNATHCWQLAPKRARRGNGSKTADTATTEG
jgi:hypothetical protein